MALPATSSFPQSGNIVSRWKLGEAAGTSRADSVGSNTLTDNNTVGQGTGQFSANDATFVSASNQFLSITNAAQTGLNITGDLTISAWMFRTTAAEYILGKYDTSTNLRQYLFGYGTDAGPEGLFFYNSSTGSNVVDKGSATTISASAWHLVQAVYTASAGSVAFYVDGAQSGTTQTGFFTSNFSGASTFNVGGFNSTGRFDGSLQDAMIWNVALSGSDITNLYNAYFATSATTTRLLTLMGVGT